MRKRNHGNDRGKRNMVGGLLMLAIVMVFVRMLLPVPAVAEGTKESKWAGVDEAVIEKIAKEHGREAKEPLIGDDQGDILLFLFLLAGAAGGFVAGYYWRVLVAGKRQQEDLRKSVPDLPGGKPAAGRRE